jgi:hypothetical protein
MSKLARPQRAYSTPRRRKASMNSWRGRGFWPFRPTLLTTGNSEISEVSDIPFSHHISLSAPFFFHTAILSSMAALIGSLAAASVPRSQKLRKRGLRPRRAIAIVFFATCGGHPQPEDGTDIRWRTGAAQDASENDPARDPRLVRKVKYRTATASAARSFVSRAIFCANITSPATRSPTGTKHHAQTD